MKREDWPGSFLVFVQGFFNCSICEPPSKNWLLLVCSRYRMLAHASGLQRDVIDALSIGHGPNNFTVEPFEICSQLLSFLCSRRVRKVPVHTLPAVLRILAMRAKRRQKSLHSHISNQLFDSYLPPSVLFASVSTGSKWQLPASAIGIANVKH